MSTDTKMPVKQQIRVIVADDHSIVRRGLCELLNATDDIEVVADVGTPNEAIDAIEKHHPDVALLDLQYEGVKSFDMLKDIRSRCPQVRTLILSMHDESHYAERCIRAGAMGYVMKNEAADNILSAIRKVKQGQLYLSDTMSGRMLNVLLERGGNPAASERTVVDVLTDRELQVFELLGQGMTTREVAQRLHLSVKTIETHRLNIMSKLQIPNPNELIRRAVQWVDSEGEGG